LVKILVAGGAGFIGSHLCERLLKDGNIVHCLDNLSSGVEGNLNEAKNHPNFRFYRADVRVPIMLDESYDVIYNLASRASRKEWETFPTELLSTAADGNKNLLEFAKKSSSKFIFLSTSEIYGDAEIIPTPESYEGKVSPIGSRSPYDEGKRYGEALVMAYHREFKINTTIIRLFNTYGPRIRGGDMYGRVIPRFIEQAISSSPLTVYGDGSQTRSFAYIDDVAEALSLFVDEDTNGEVFNIGYPVETTILQLAKLVIEIVKSSSSITFLPLPEHDPKRRCPDTTLAKSRLKWTPKVGLQEGIARMIENFSKVRSTSSITYPRNITLVQSR
jgi:nucleoside-diphosphate-sugar epimerase